MPHVDGAQPTLSPYRRLTAFARVLPDFVIVGAQKCGTTSLYKYLIEHPQILPAVRKELRFFSTPANFTRGTRWYRSCFPSAVAMGYRAWRVGGAVLTGEGTPGYMMRPGAVERMAQVVPHARLIVLLRDPVERSYSQYQMQRRKGKHCLTFDQALATEETLVAGRMEEALCNETLVGSPYFYRVGGLYALQLQRLYRHYDPSRVLVVCSEEFFANPEATLHQVCGYLGLPAVTLRRYIAHTKGPAAPDMEPETRKRLTRYFAPYNERVYELVGRDYGWQR